MTVRINPAGSALVTAAAFLLSLSGVSADDKVNRVTTVPIPGRGQPLVAKADAEGAIHLLFGTADGPQYVKSLDKGKTFSASIPVVDKAARKPGLEFHGWDMVVGQGGHVHVAMGTNAWKLKLPVNEWGFYYAR